METPIFAHGEYEHYKEGKRYRVLMTARHSETLEELVIYETLYDNELGRHWARPRSMFCESVRVEGVRRPRFRYIEGTGTTPTRT